MQSWRRRKSGLKAWPLLGVLIIQFLLFLAHGFLYHTWIAFFPSLAPVVPWLRPTMLVLAFSFAPITLLTFRFSNPLVNFCYIIAAIWLGFLNFLFFAACLSWPLWYALRLAASYPIAAATRPWICGMLACVAVVAGIYGLVNARYIRVHRVAVRLPDLPAPWLGRTAVLISDLHLGAVNGLRFNRRITAMAATLRPDIVFLPGDVFDGTKLDLDRTLTPFKQLASPFGIYFSTGNHEEFVDPAHYIEAMTRAGIRVLTNERVTVEGLHIAGVSYGLTHSPMRMRAALEAMRIESGQAGILLNHVPTRLPLVEAAGFALQLSGHTHRGQIFPFTWLTQRIFGAFTYGLHSFGMLQVFTSCGAGTWGPPMRVGSSPEIVAITFE
jgi:predicted MPP superfamily phosphohydrolase